MLVTPFRIAVPDEVLDDLRRRLAGTRFPGEVAASGWSYGTNLGYLRDLVSYWHEKYDWRAAESTINQLPQFTAEIDGTTLHFVHRRGAGPSPTPLLFVHGWPGSFWEVHKIIGPLCVPAASGGDPGDAFDVVAVSLPGYGFSPDPGAAGMDPGRIADLLVKLMTEVLGYERFVAQGGDWGAIIGSYLAERHPDRILGLHLNLPGAVPDFGPGAPELSPAEQQFVSDSQQWRAAEGAYAQLHGTKPQTIAYALNDSPAGLAAWIVEKFRGWSDCHGDIETRFTKDELLTNIMIYWVSASIGSSVRLYREAAVTGTVLTVPAGRPLRVPTAYARFAVDIVCAPVEWMKRMYTLTRYTEFDRGGHFAAIEEPELLAADVRAFVRSLRA